MDEGIQRGPVGLNSCLFPETRINVYHHSHQSRKLQGVRGKFPFDLSIPIVTHMHACTHTQKCCFEIFSIDSISCWSFDGTEFKTTRNQRSSSLPTYFTEEPKWLEKNSWIKKCTLTRRIYIKGFIWVHFLSQYCICRRYFFLYCSAFLELTFCVWKIIYWSVNKVYAIVSRLCILSMQFSGSWMLLFTSQ